MATVDEPSLVDTGGETLNPLHADAIGDAITKRKASPDVEDHAAKRTRHDSADDDRGASASAGSAAHHRARDDDQRGSDDRRRSAVQEEKKRSKRLFGGLLSTLSQTTANPHQKRRQEIELRQQERLQQQRAEDEQKREENSARLRDVRMAQQIVWDEEVMRNKHSKVLDLARYIQTNTKPHIFYLPWKLTDEQRDIIDDQIREAHMTVEKEAEEFETRKRQHAERYGPRRQPSVTPNAPVDLADSADSAASIAPIVTESPKDGHNNAESSPNGFTQTKAVQAHSEEHHHDDSNDVMVEAGEDMVIY